MKKRTKLYIQDIPPVSHEFAKELQKRFPAVQVKPGINPDDAMYNAGQQSVVNWVITRASGSTISGNIEDIKKDEVNISLVDKLLGVFNANR